MQKVVITEEMLDNQVGFEFGMGFENEMSRSVSTCSQMAFHMETVGLVQSFWTMVCRRNAVSKWKDY